MSSICGQQHRRTHSTASSHFIINDMHIEFWVRHVPGSQNSVFGVLVTITMATHVVGASVYLIICAPWTRPAVMCAGNDNFNHFEYMQPKQQPPVMRWPLFLVYSCAGASTLIEYRTCAFAHNESYIIHFLRLGDKSESGRAAVRKPHKTNSTKLGSVPDAARSFAACVPRTAWPSMPSILMHSPSSNTFTYRMRALIRLIKTATARATHFGWVSRVCTFVRVWLITADICLMFLRAKKCPLLTSEMLGRELELLLNVET